MATATQDLTLIARTTVTPDPRLKPPHMLPASVSFGSVPTGYAYFQIAVLVPTEDFDVNLRPDDHGESLALDWVGAGSPGWSQHHGRLRWNPQITLYPADADHFPDGTQVVLWGVR